MEQKKVIFVTGALADGGAERVMSILASGCAELDADVTLVVLREKKQIYSISEKVNVIQIVSEKDKNTQLSRIKQLRDILKNSEANTVIPFLPLVTLYTMIANIGIGKKIIMSERADPNVSIFDKHFNLKDRIGNLLMRKIGLFNKANWMVFQTTDAQAYYNKNLQKKSSIIPNPLDTEHLPQRFCDEREKRIVAAGRFSEEKNFPLLIDGFAAFNEKHPEYSLTIYGEGSLRKEYETQIARLGLTNCISLPGFSSNLTEEINRAAVYVSTSNHEGISNSMLEALGMGIPTIVTDCPIGGSRMFVKNYENGILIPMNNKEALVAGLNKIVEDVQFAKNISIQASKIRERLSYKNICREWLELVD